MLIRLLIFFIIFGIFSCKKHQIETTFTLLSPNETGIKFKNVLRETEEFNVLVYSYLYNGGGVSIGDINNDSLPDIYFTGNMVGSGLYLNKGNFKFEEISLKAGVFAEGFWNTGTTMVDINADGFLDIYVCRSIAKDSERRRNLLFINNGNLTFTEKAAEYGIDDPGHSTQGAFFDYDRDGDLDLYVLNQSSPENLGNVQISSTLRSRKDNVNGDSFYKNENGKFKEVSDLVGINSNILGFGLGIAVSDINNDEWPDIYISNDFNEPDYLYVNNQDGTFSQNLEEYIGHTSLYSMGSDIADVNNDGYPEIFTLDMLPEGNNRQKMVSGPDNYAKYDLLVNSGFYHQIMRNMMHLNNQGESFSEIGQFSGISNTDWSWASLFADFDNDGFKDLFITNGYKRDYTNMDFINYAVQEKLNENKGKRKMAIMKLMEEMPSTIIENYMYHNNGDLTFSKVNDEWGLNQKSLSNGAAYADLDNDGDLDLVVNNLDEHPFVYKNNSEIFKSNNFLKFRFNGEGKNTYGIGTKVELKLGNKVLMQELMPTRGFQSSVDFNLIFGLGKAELVDQVKITWADGKIQVLKQLKSNQTIVLNQKEAQNMVNIGADTINKTYFTELTKDKNIQFLHKENSFEDFDREKLLPHKLSKQGPKIAKGDVNGDGLEDIFIGAAKGSSGNLFIQTNSGEFVLGNIESFDLDKESEDTAALFFDADNDNDMDLYVVSGGNDFNENSPELQDRLYFNNGEGHFSRRISALPKMISSGSCIREYDLDNDGDLDLFVGGRLVPGKYPTPSRSYILDNDGKGNFKDVTSIINSELEYPGMVTDAIWTDFNDDKFEDLILVGEWMKIRTFRNVNGKLIELPQNNGLQDSSGWWNRIEEGDFDNDGDMDYILGNFGLNSQLKASVSQPVTLYVKDFDDNGTLDPIMCSYVMGESYPVYSKDDLLGQLSKLKTKYINYSDYADQKITDIFSEEELNNSIVLMANNFNSSYMENIGDGKFKLSPLPDAAQFAPIYGLLIGDFNKDGNNDVILGGNFFGTRVKYGRYDANKGVCLFGDGNGEFRSVGTPESGLNINGEVRDITKIILADKREILLFARNNDEIIVYKINPIQSKKENDY